MARGKKTNKTKKDVLGGLGGREMYLGRDRLRKILLFYSKYFLYQKETNGEGARIDRRLLSCLMPFLAAPLD